MAKNKINVSMLGQAIDTSWGRSSTPNAASFSVKMSLLGSDQLMATYQAIVNFGTENEWLTMRKRYEEESVKCTAAQIKRAKEIYKDLSGDALTVKESSTDISLDVIGVTFHNPKRTAYFKRKTIFDIS